MEVEDQIHTLLFKFLEYAGWAVDALPHRKTHRTITIGGEIVKPNSCYYFSNESNLSKVARIYWDER